MDATEEEVDVAELKIRHLEEKIQEGNNEVDN
jgi:anti-sigma28 factor (negative regulator of flagellin synthesis)